MFTPYVSRLPPPLPTFSRFYYRIRYYLGALLPSALPKPDKEAAGKEESFLRQQTGMENGMILNRFLCIFYKRFSCCLVTVIACNGVYQ